MTKKVLLFVLITAAAAAEICMYRNHRILNISKAAEDPAEKIRILEKASGGLFSHESVHYEMGKAAFDLGQQNIRDRNRSLSFFLQSAESFNRSLGLNPASPFVHLLFARTLSHLEYYNVSRWPDFFDEYKKAARLTGHHSEIRYQVAQVFLYRWENLNESDRRFAVDTLSSVLREGWRDKLDKILQIWNLTVGDEDVLRAVLPVDASVYRKTARFIGEKSLSLPFRHDLLVRAEMMDFDEARIIHDRGVREYQYYRMDEAEKQLMSSLRILDRVKFYDVFWDEEAVNRVMVKNLRRSLHLHLAKCLIEQGKGLKEVSPHIDRYLDLAGQQHEVSELISYLESRHFIPEKMAPNFEDLSRLAFQIKLYFKNNRYRDIVALGNLMGKSLVVVPETKKEEYVDLLLLLGESYQKVDYIFEAARLLEMAFEADKKNLQTLLHLRQNYTFLNMSDKLNEVNARIKDMVFPPEKEYRNRIIDKRRHFPQKMLFDGEKKIVALTFQTNGNRGKPLISVFFNGRIIWEDYLPEEKVSVTLDTLPGSNLLEIQAVNMPVQLEKISVS